MPSHNAEESGENPAADLREIFREIKKFVVFLRNKQNTNIILVVLTFALAIASFTQAVIYGLQLKPLKDSAKAATSASNAAEQSSETARGAMLIDERAWLKVITGTPDTQKPEVANVSITMTIDKPLNVPLTIKNIGKTAAQRVLAYAIVEVVKFGKEPNIPDRQSRGFPQIDHPTTAAGKPTHAPSAIYGSLIYPGEWYTSSVPRLGVAEKQSAVFPLSKNEFESLRKGESYMAVYGAVTYFDIFGVFHWTKFCKSIRVGMAGIVPSESVACANYAAIDNNTK